MIINRGNSSAEAASAILTALFIVALIAIVALAPPHKAAPAPTPSVTGHALPNCLVSGGCDSSYRPITLREAVAIAPTDGIERDWYGCLYSVQAGPRAVCPNGTVYGS